MQHRNAFLWYDWSDFQLLCKAARKTNTGSLTSLHCLRQADRDLSLTLGNTRQKSCQDNAWQDIALLFSFASIKQVCVNDKAMQRVGRALLALWEKWKSPGAEQDLTWLVVGCRQQQQVSVLDLEWHVRRGILTHWNCLLPSSEWNGLEDGQLYGDLVSNFGNYLCPHLRACW